jgi:hypoxanthine phosphoribosyltransferase
MKQPRVIIDRGRIDARVTELAAEISEDYGERNPLLIGVLKGSFVFVSDLIRRLGIPVEVEFVRLSSYGAGTETSGGPRVVDGIGAPVEGRDLLLVEDIVDTGLTVRFLVDYFGRMAPASVHVCTLFDKPSRRRVAVPLRYVGFTIPDEFVVGYGLDCGERWRHLPDLCAIEAGE